MDRRVPGGGVEAAKAMNNPLDPDANFFRQHSDRQTLIRLPFGDEGEDDFNTLGPHARERRRIIVYKVPENNVIAPGKLLRIPFLAFSDENIENSDAVLLPFVHEIMRDAAASYGMKPIRPKR